MLIRSFAIFAGLACLTALLLAALSPPIGSVAGEFDFSLVGLAGLGLVTLRSEAHWRTPRGSDTRGS